MAHCIEGRIFRKIKTLLNRHLRSVESDKSYQLRLKILFLVPKKYVAALNIYIYTHSGYTCVYIIYILYIHISSPVCKTHTCPMHIYALYHIDLVTLMDGDNDTNTACHRCPTLGPQTLWPLATASVGMGGLPTCTAVGWIKNDQNPAQP